ncbi:TPA: restriction endonuclease subunit S [Klebsiella pneumoniae]|uniref:restriction endonuclease subunit S n=1 Tax=Enterobacterales TaxID=91347 RepID=UPI000B417E57|nr:MULTISPECIES: restriction endonuclease subunit S [Enterobacteriaceae]MBF0033676.1 restriction endonuclease subunit S [Citrobacter freundii]MBJ8871557.1 restriction endonuclease subunit S [Citrobacter braakii]HDS4388357.1 restriction endonuclease subunit S [Enterobacter roggenkampii]MBC5444135.1 restriction endonuclease subunit S [Klebsiella pneumoniae]MBJ8902676.1 restriction endonuclease subunit S [Citrobacter braakii]
MSLLEQRKNIPDDWINCELGEVLTLQRGYDLPHRLRKDGKVPIISSSGVSGRHDKAMVSPPGVVTGRYGTIGEIFYVNEPFWPLNTTLYVRDFRGMTAEYAYHFLKTINFESHSGKSGVPGINRNDVHKEIVYFPINQIEQTAIVNILNDTDVLISELEKLIAKKQAIKTAAMQQLLTGRTRLPQFAKQPSGAIKNYKSSELGIIPDDWETVAMGEMGVTYGGLSGKSKNDFGSGNSLYVPFTNIMANVIVNVNHLERVNVQETQRQVLPGDLLFNGSSETPEEVCFCSLMSEEIDKLYLNSFCFGFRANSQPKYLPLYIAYWFRSSAGRTAVSIMAQGSTRYNISKSQFLTLKIVLPPILEQTAIATVLSDMDAELEKLEQKLAKIRDIKQGMMQQLLTGRIRLPLDHQP